ELQVLDVVFRQRFLLLVPAGALVVAAVGGPVIEGAAGLCAHDRDIRQASRAPRQAAEGGHRRHGNPILHVKTSLSLRGASPLGLPYTLARGGPHAPLRSRGSLAALARASHGTSPLGLPYTLAPGAPPPPLPPPPSPPPP